MMVDRERVRAAAWHQVRFALPVWLVMLALECLPDNRVSITFRGWCLRPFIAQCGKGFQVGRGVTLLNTDQLVIGQNVYLARGVWMNALGGLTIEDEVVLAPYVTVSTLRHEFADGSVRFGGSTPGPVRIGRGSWLAAHASVAMGVTIGQGCIVAANSAVTKDVAANLVVGGVPAREIGPRLDKEPSIRTASDVRSPE